jgi:hypothetical protein
MRRIFTPQEIKLATDLYNNGKQQWEVGLALNCKQTTISSILRRNGVPTRVGKKIIYTDVNINFFKEINCEESAYFLGLLYADGCVQTDNTTYSVSLQLKSSDQYIIEKFRNIMSPSSIIKTSCGGKYSHFRVYQKEICDQLIFHGCIPRKSLVLQFPTTVPSELIRHFLRGYSDGDGTIYKNRQKQKTPTSKQHINTIWKFVSTKQFCNTASKILQEQVGITCSQSLSKPKTNQITTVLAVGGNLQVRKVLDWLYQDATIYLPRKYDRYMEFVNGQK